MEIDRQNRQLYNQKKYQNSQKHKKDGQKVCHIAKFKFFNKGRLHTPKNGNDKNMDL